MTEKMSPSPEDEKKCVKCDILLCQELSVTSPHAELLKVNLEQRESVKRNLNFDDYSSFRDSKYDEGDTDSDSTLSYHGLGGSPNKSSPDSVKLPFYSSSSSLDSIPREENSPAKVEWESTDECLAQDIYCREVLSPSPPPKLVYLSQKRQRSRATFDLHASGSCVVKKKKKVDA